MPCNAPQHSDRSYHLRSQSLTSKQDHRQYPASEVSGAVAGGGVYPSGTAKQPPQFLPYQGLANLAMVSGQCLAIAGDRMRAKENG
ncbi:MAG: hypothetical protein HC936_15540 [Leptolyngbyaceae cyanobacterium SU_3_3]|nr:hypothetical protein [Leptolyngbyaceae cyanobacterium SU_3_3]